MNLGLGTVQFGVDYGISNTHGRCTPEEISSILSLAQESGVAVLDTAADYGTSEAEIGRALGGASSFRVVTKTPSLADLEDREAKCLRIRETLHRTLERLGTSGVYGLILHHCDDLLSADGEALFGTLRELQAEGLVEKIGVSLYNRSQIDRVLDKVQVGLVQVPVSVLDQRLVANGGLRRLKQAGAEVHARSIFLQGLVLMEPDRLPSHVMGAAPALRCLSRYAKEAGMSRLEVALAFIRNREELDCALVGVTARAELSEILAAWRRVKGRRLDADPLAVSDEAIVNPSLWRTAS